MKIMLPPRLMIPGAVLLFLLLTACTPTSPAESWPNVTTDGQYLYVAVRENVFRVNPVPDVQGQPVTRKIEWLAKTPDNAHASGSVTIADDKTLYVSANINSSNSRVFNVIAFQQIASPTGTRIGSSATDRYIGSPLIVGDMIYVGRGDNGVDAFNRKENRKEWTFPDTKFGVWATPVFSNGILYAASLDHFLYALDAKTGTLKWKLDLGGAIAGTPLLDGDVLYVGTFNNELVSINLNDSKVANRFKARGWVWGTPILFRDGENRSLLFADVEGWVYAINPATFEKRWEATDKERPGGIFGKLALAKIDNRDIVIAGSISQYLRAYDAKTGDVVWTSGTKAIGKIYSDLIVMGEDVIFTTLDDTQILAAFNVKTGRENWKVNLNDERKRLETAPLVPLNATNPAGAATPAPTAAATAASTAVPTAAATVQQ